MAQSRDRGPAGARRSHNRSGQRSTEAHGLAKAIFPGAAILFFLFTLLGGGGAPAPLMQALLESIAAIWICFLLWAHFFVQRISPESRTLLLVLVGTFGLAFAHLLPLPYGMWSSLPGRGPAVAAVELSGLGRATMPFSLMPEGTRLAILQLLPATAILLSVYFLDPTKRLALLLSPLLTAVLSASIGVLQALNSGDGRFYLFSRSIFSSPSGLFANRNFQSDFLLIGIILCALYIREARIAFPTEPAKWRRRTIAAAFAAAFLATMVLATLSRSGALFLGPVLAAFVVIGPGWKLQRKGMGLAAGGAVAAGLLILAAKPIWAGLAERFRGSASRLDAWPDLAHAAQTYWPVGSGLGTFNPVFRAAESLHFLVPRYFNHAHNDYFEIIIEAGLPGVLLLAWFLALYVFRSLKAIRTPAVSSYDWAQIAAAIIIGLLLVHSAADYPLRTITLQCVFAYFGALLFSNRSGPGKEAPPRTSSEQRS